MTTPTTRAQRLTRALPLALALAAVAGVWLAGAIWSFDEQTRYAASRGFALPWLLPLVLDGLAVSLAGVAYAAALDGRAAVQARAMTALAVAASAASNGAWAWTRTGGDPGAIALATGVPVAANIAFEVLLSELRRQVHRRRGVPVAEPVPMPRLSRVLLAPRTSLGEWRAHVLAITAPAPASQPEPRPALAAARRPRAITATATGHAAAARAREVTPDLPDLAPDLLDVARDVAGDLREAGRPITRVALVAGIRGRGRTVSNARAGELLTHLRDMRGEN